eukprot:9002427-Pyramimonas_sp.AAC.1
MHRHIGTWKGRSLGRSMHSKIDGQVRAAKRQPNTTKRPAGKELPRNLLCNRQAHITYLRLLLYSAGQASRSHRLSPPSAGRSKSMRSTAPVATK